MIKSCVIGLSKVGIIHCESILKIKNTSLNYVFDKNYKDYVFRYKGYKIWGMTGKILYYFLNNIK